MQHLFTTSLLIKTQEISMYIFLFSLYIDKLLETITHLTTCSGQNNTLERFLLFLATRNHTKTHALTWAHSQGWRCISFFTDCANLIMALKYPMNVPSSVYWTIRDIKCTADSFSWCFLLKVNRQQV